MEKKNQITQKRLEKYFSISEEAYSMAIESGNRHPKLSKEREDFLDMIKRYIKDSKHFCR